MDSQIKISIIVPVYNVELYLEECFNSIIRQTMTDGIECIFVDDCGTDGSKQLLEKLIASYKGNIKMRLVHHKKNRGLSAARNTGTDLAVGQYVFYIDSDDKITPDCIKELWALAIKYPGVDIVQSSTISKEMSQIFDLSLESKHLPEYSNDSEWIRKALMGHRLIPGTAWNRLIRKSFIVDNNLSFPEEYIHEDEFWTYRAQKCIGSMAFNKHFTYYYRTNPQSITHNVSQKSIFSMEKFATEISDTIGSNGMVKDELKLLVLINSQILSKQPGHKVVGNIEGLSKLVKYYRLKSISRRYFPIKYFAKGRYLYLLNAISKKICFSKSRQH